MLPSIVEQRSYLLIYNLYLFKYSDFLFIKFWRFVGGGRPFNTYAGEGDQQFISFAYVYC